jgi:hypothetical protein
VTTIVQPGGIAVEKQLDGLPSVSVGPDVVGFPPSFAEATEGTILRPEQELFRAEDYLKA